MEKTFKIEGIVTDINEVEEEKHLRITILGKSVQNETTEQLESFRVTLVGLMAQGVAHEVYKGDEITTSGVVKNNDILEVDLLHVINANYEEPNEEKPSDKSGKKSGKRRRKSS